MPKRKRQNKAQIKREIAQFLASNQTSTISVPVLKSQPAMPDSSNVVIADQWSATTLAEIKKIAILLAVLLIILIGLTIADRKTSLVDKIGDKILNALEL